MHYGPFRLVPLLLFVCLICNSMGQTGTLVLTVAYCPTDFTGAGAIVNVDIPTGDWTIVGKFKWPSVVLGCPDNEDTTIAFDPATDLLYIYFEDESTLTILNVGSAEIVASVAIGDIWFTGFENMAYNTKTGLINGVSGNVTSDGYCDDGCYAYGTLSTDHGTYKHFENIPFQAVMDDSHYLDETSNTYWVQCSQDLRTPNEWCASDPQDLCLLNIDTETGRLRSSVYTNWTIYKYGPVQSDGTVMVWLNGFSEYCGQDPLDSYLFARLNLSTADATPIACIPKDVIIQEDEWIASFSLDGTLFATGSGDADTGSSQLLAFNTSTGALVLNSTLSGLAEALHSAEGQVLVWSVDFVRED